MPKPAPKIPAKPNSLKIPQPKSNPPRAGRDGRGGQGGFRNPGPRVKARAKVGDDKEEPAEAAEEQKNDGDKEEEKAGENKDEQQGDEAPADERPEALPADKEAMEKAKKKANQHPQKTINKLWKNYDPVYLGRVTKVLPQSVPASTTPKSKPQRSQNASESYKEARAQCERDVQRIITECRALNQKYTDTHFDIERDLKVNGNRDCLDGLVADEDERFSPQDVKRDIFENPTFYADGAGFDDIMQGGIGDCWMMSAFSVLTCNEDLVRKVCVIQDQEVGVYGFVFFRDGEWHQTIIDDKLYLSKTSYEEGVDTSLWNWGNEQEKKYNELFQRGSKALYFAKCRDDNETWVPLLEKALAKAHGGYDALIGGQTGEALEDLTGGVTTELYTTNILSKNKFWTNELRKIGRDFMFDATDAVYREWQGWDRCEAIATLRDEIKKGVTSRHAYAVLDTYEGYGEKLVRVRNPWGKSEWKGSWSDGSAEWTAEWLQRLGHKFGDDGVFWMSYNDFLKTYTHLNRTRIFDDSWYTAQKWATVQVPFSTVDYQQTKFQIDVPDDTESVIVLSQLDTRYFRGLEGRYDYVLQFRISEAEKEDEYIVRSKPNYELDRSTNVEIHLRKGKYTVLIKVEAQDRERDNPDQVIKENLPERRTKVTTIGRLYDLAHQKGLPETEEEPQPPAEIIKEAATDAETQIADASTSTAEASTATNTSADTPATIPDRDAAAAAGDAGSDDDSDDEDEKSPWNASCIIGLRVYSKQPELAVSVILPPKPKVEEPVKPSIDRDDITKAPQMEAEEAEKEGKDDAKGKEKEEKKKEEKKEEKEKEEEKKEKKKEETKEESEKKEEKGKKAEYDGIMGRPKGAGALPMRGKMVRKAEDVEVEEDWEEEEEEEEESDE